MKVLCSDPTPHPALPDHRAQRHRSAWVGVDSARFDPSVGVAAHRDDRTAHLLDERTRP